MFGFAPVSRNAAGDRAIRPGVPGLEVGYERRTAQVSNLGHRQRISRADGATQ